MNTVSIYFFFLLFLLSLSNNIFAASSIDLVETSFYEESAQHTQYFKLSLNKVLTVDASVTYRTKNGSALAGHDYIATSGTATISAGETSTLIPVEILGDKNIEKNETFSLVISNPIAVFFPDNQSNLTATYTILNDDIQTRVYETDRHHTHHFLLEIPNPMAINVSVDYETRDGTAHAGEDYQSTSGVATITAGETKTLIAVEILGDTKIENNETFSLVVSNPVGANFVAGVTELVATHTIVNDDYPIAIDPTQSIAKNLSRTMLSGITPILETQTVLEQPSTLANAFALNISNKILDCPSSGTFEFTFNDDASNDLKYSKVNDSLAITTNQCNNGTTTSNGAYRLKIIAVGAETRSSELTLTNLSIIDSSTNSIFTGTLNTSEFNPSNNDDSVLQINSNNLQLNSNGASYLFTTIDTQIATETASSERKLQRYNTSVVLSNSSNNGNYNTAIINPLKIAATDKYPREGQLQIQRQDETMNIIITVIDTTRVRIETDTSGDHIADYSQDVLWSELSNGF